MTLEQLESVIEEFTQVLQTINKALQLLSNILVDLQDISRNQKTDYELSQFLENLEEKIKEAFLSLGATTFSLEYHITEEKIKKNKYLLDAKKK